MVVLLDGGWVPLVGWVRAVAGGHPAGSGALP
ncbi:hypothetical protein Ksed_16910 [Kytococcus sedentarius DSM 20547]|uniref:Uncharacterized protein n=1 Tax=Kytococcus sedentarius (strain ATCC 14392 / DSM 20547 / JCM 11482 / CCUG 33030 / NBRC 15357 / NCTC 11040 / CCM 314 / 541) TaxID=478801 RepID=C7NIR8_KYTSD|nr:hypothetical protein Ksed_16910 [Kytococcus sedentarius DSM 20547]